MSGPERLQIEFNANDPASIALALKSISEHFETRIANLEREIAASKLADNCMLLLEEDDELRTLSNSIPKRKIRDALLDYARQCVAGQLSPESESVELTRQVTTACVRLAASNGVLIDPAQGEFPGLST